MANNWEYHQDERDQACGCGALLLLGIVSLMFTGFIVEVALKVISLF